MKPGRELDALVAEKVFGCKPSKSQGPFFSERNKEAKEVYFCSCPSSIHDEFILEQDLEQNPPTVERVSIGLKKYSTSILAAWEVVEKFEVVEIIKGEEFARCRIRVGKGHPAYEDSNDYVSDESDTASIPFAICLAALRAVENF